MSLSNRIAWDDTVLPFQLDRSDVRGRVARLDGALDAILGQHDYPPKVEALTSEAVLLTALIGSTIKLRWKLSLQIRGKGGVRLIATDYFAPQAKGDSARIRAYAGFDERRFDASRSAFAEIADGYFAVLIDQGPGTEPYQGIAPLTGGSLAACAQAYFAQSEQLSTGFFLAFAPPAGLNAAAGWCAGGIMLQHMPDVSPAVSGEPAGLRKPAAPLGPDDDENWNRANILMNSVTDAELLGPQVQASELLVRLFHEEGVRVFDPQPVTFGCTCSADRVRQSLSIYSARDIAHMTTEAGIVTADCQFCGAHYQFRPETLGFEAREDPGGES